MSFTTTLADLSPARRELVELMRVVRFGRIEDLRVQDGEPVLEPMPIIVRSVRFGAGGYAPSRGFPRPRLKPHHLQLMRQLDELGTGRIEVLHVQDGLPISARLGPG